jgi:hypothetical protein
MKHVKSLLPLLALCAWPATEAQQPITREVLPDAEGLVRVKIGGLQQVYTRPDAQLSGYDKLLLDPIEVSIRKDWDPRPAGRPISVAARQRIKEGLARVLREEFTKEIEAGGRYEVVDQADEGVLRVRAEIRDLYITAPDPDHAGIVRTYTVSLGEMTLVAELRDAPTGELLARVIDNRRDPDRPWLELTTRIENVAAARRAAANWARILRGQLDVAHAAPK